MKSVFARRIAFCGTLACALTAWSPRSVALDPVLDISQYAHTAWRIREGFPKGVISAFAQTPDGYLWLGTELGLVRFDGVRNVAWQPPAGESLPDSRVRSLLSARDGTLWIGTSGGLASWNGTKLTNYPELTGQVVDSLVEDREGTVWVGIQMAPLANPVAGLCTIHNGSARCDGKDGSLGRGGAILFEDTKGRLWAGVREGVWRWKPGPAKLYPLPNPVASLQSLIEGTDGALLVATRGGMMQIVDDKVVPFPLPGMPLAVLRDRDGAVWFGTRDGLLRMHRGRTDRFARSNGLSSDWTARLFEDREGNIWVATIGGLDRFREFAAATYSVDEGVSGFVAAVLVARDGSVWLSTLSGLKRWSNGEITAYRTRHGYSPKESPRSAVRPPAAHEVIVEGALPERAGSLFQDDHARIWLGTDRGLGYLDGNRFVTVRGVPAGFIDSITQDGGGVVWVAHREVGLLRVSSEQGFEQIPWSQLGDRGPAARLAADSSGKGLWLGFFSGGIAQVVDGRVWASYTERDGLAKGRVDDLRIDRDGALWAGAYGGLSRLKNGRLATLDHESGLPCDHVASMIEDLGAVWLYTHCGLVRIARAELDAWAASVDQGKDARRTIRAAILDDSDGIASVGIFGTYGPHAAKSADGKLWLGARDGVTVVEPRHLSRNALPPPVHVEQIIADHHTYPASSHVRLPPLVRDLQIDYTALSLAAPEKVQFRYKLEGRDRDWQDADNRRQAFYTDPSPGQYRFRVMASNNSGVWNEQGDVLDFSIAPAYWQTNWFRALCVAALLALLWALYQLRVWQLRREFGLTLEARVGERTRIARDLHDTLLQSFQGLLMRFQTAYDLFQTRPTEARQTLGSAINQAIEAISEGRDAVQSLRSSASESNDLALAIETFGEELASEEAGHGSAALKVTVEGTPRAVHPILRDEIYRIASEALRNAFRHARATQIEVELRYANEQLRLRVRDDGKGMDPELLSGAEPEGHFGLPGMRERARLIGGKLTVWSALDSGTEVELSIPASRAYAAPSSPRRSWFAGKFSTKSTSAQTPS